MADAIRCLLDLMEKNVEHNGVGENVHVAELSWGEEMQGVPRNIDIVLAADCVYFEVSLAHPVKWSWLTGSLHSLCSCKRCVISLR